MAAPAPTAVLPPRTKLPQLAPADLSIRVLVGDCSTDDALALQPLWTELSPDAPADPAAFASSIQQLLRTEPLRIVTARAAAADGGGAAASPALLGFCTLRTYNNTFNTIKAHLESIAVAAPHRSRGIGTQLCNESKRLAAQAGATEIVTYPGTQQFEATRFFFQQRMIIQCMYFNGSTDSKPAARNNDASSPMSPASPLSPDSAASAAAPAASSFVTTCIDPCNPSASDLALLRAGEGVHRQLRMKLPAGTEAYLARMRVIGADGARMVVAAEQPAAGSAASASASPVVLGVGVYRFYSVSQQLKCFVDDLITDANRRSLGVGAAMLEAIRAECRARGIHTFQLDSGVHRQQAHKFYFKQGMVIDRFSFGGPLQMV